jgi:hypothetical protein
MWLTRDRDQANLVIGSGIFLGAGAKRDDHVACDALGDGGRGQRAFFQHGPGAVVANTAHITALGGHDLIEQVELGVAAVHDVEPVRCDGAFQDGSFIRVAARTAGDIDADGHVAVHFEMRVEPPFCQAAARFGFLEGGLGHARQGVQERAIHKRDGLVELIETRVMVVGLEFLAKFNDNLLKTRRIEDIDGFGERSQRHARAAQPSLHVLQFAGLLQAAQRFDGRIEEEEKDEHAILIVMQLAVMGGVSLAADVMKAFEKPVESIQVFRPLKSVRWRQRYGHRNSPVQACQDGSFQPTIP